MTNTPSGCRWSWFGTTSDFKYALHRVLLQRNKTGRFPRHLAQQLTRGWQSALYFSLYQNTFIPVFKLLFLSPKSLPTLISAGQTLTLIRTNPESDIHTRAPPPRVSEAILRQMPHPPWSAACGTDEVRAWHRGAGPVITGLRKHIHHLPPRLAFQVKNLHTV